MPNIELRNKNYLPANRLTAQVGWQTGELRSYSIKCLKPFISKLSYIFYPFIASSSRLSLVRGFTLIEYLVVITILATLIGGLVLTLNPFGQIEKSEDASRRQDIQQVKNALEAYYQDFNCYPNELNFGQEFSVDGEIYMKELPEDPTCSQSGGSCYEYIADTSDGCSQWNVVFAKLSASSNQESGVCPLSTLSDECVPDGYDSSWACILSGAVNCQLVSVGGLDYESGSGTGSEQPTPTPTGPAPTITLSDDSSYRVIGGQSSKNPYMRRIDIDPWWASPSAAQTFVITVQDATADINLVKIHLISDSGLQVLTLNHNSGTERDGTWAGTITADTYNTNYAMALESRNINGGKACAVVTNADRGGGEEADAICEAINN